MTQQYRDVAGTVWCDSERPRRLERTIRDFEATDLPSSSFPFLFLQRGLLSFPGEMKAEIPPREETRQEEQWVRRRDGAVRRVRAREIG